MGKKTERDEPLESPIPFRPCSNGEFIPRDSSPRDVAAEDMFRRIVDDNAAQLGVSRRSFIKSSCGTASALFVINQVYGCGDSASDGTDGGFRVDAASTIDAGKACEDLAGDEFIFDVQTHHVNPDGAWAANGSIWPNVLASFPQGSCGEPDPVDCYDTNDYIREMFVNSDTAIATISAVPATPEDNPLTEAEALATARVVEMLAGTSRAITHGMVRAEQGQSELDGMQALKETQQIAAWKCYTQFGGWRLDDEVAGIPFIEKARELDVKLICAHKGLSLFGLDPQFAAPGDLVSAAAMFPDVTFMVYHSGYETGNAEGPYDPAATVGIDALITAMLDTGLGPTDNVYAELGSTWRNLITAGGVQAQHGVGKLLKQFGPDRVLWGTDSIWYGSPQDQIDAFRTFEISEQLREDHGYPELTCEVKRKIFGLNAAAIYGIDPAATVGEITGDQLSRRRADRDRPAPSRATYGPRTRREFFEFLRLRDGQPG